MEEVRKVAKALTEETGKVIVGKESQIELMIAALFAEGHVLIEDMPGVGKTSLIKALSKALGFEMRRIQFTPDLLPSDVIGMNIYDRNSGNFRFLPGPVETNILLADEINRAIPRTQSALLEAMEERQITVDGTARMLPKPFFVLATQNPVESESTFRLPEAQLDRFMIRISLGYPEMEEEVEILKNKGSVRSLTEICAVTSPEDFAKLQEKCRQVYASEAVLDYIARLVRESRERTDLKYGASPRASLALLRMGQALAAIQGRDYLTPDDVKKCARVVLVHRIRLSGKAAILGKNEEDIILEILEHTLAAPSEGSLWKKGK